MSFFYGANAKCIKKYQKENIPSAKNKQFNYILIFSCVQCMYLKVHYVTTPQNKSLFCSNVNKYTCKHTKKSC